MREISELKFTDGVSYSEEHTWARKEGDLVIIGISDYAQEQLGEIVFVETPDLETSFSRGQVFGAIESLKTMSDLIMPVGGFVVSVNETLKDNPEIVNLDPYEAGWIIAIKPDDISEFETLLTAESYRSSLI